MSLDIAIATYGMAGIRRMIQLLLPTMRGVRYVVSWQAHNGAEIPPEMIRDDIEVWKCDAKGLSRNRNNALEHCRADIVLIGDDDVVYSHLGLQKVIDTFDELPEMDLAMFRANFPTERVYPSESCQLRIPFPKGYSPSAIEMAFRRDSLEGMRFHPLLGLNAPKFKAGEDDFFLLSAIKRGYDCRFVDELICMHPGEPTGEGRVDAGILRASGLIIRIMYPSTWLSRIALKAYRVSKKRACGYLQALRWLMEGAKESRKFRL